MAQRIDTMSVWGGIALAATVAVLPACSDLERIDRQLTAMLVPHKQAVARPQAQAQPPTLTRKPGRRSADVPVPSPKPLPPEPPQVAAVVPPVPPSPAVVPAPTRLTTAYASPHLLVGKTEDAVRALLGEPEARRPEGSSEVWRYETANCPMELYFFTDLKTGEMKALAYQLDAGCPLVADSSP